MADSVEDVVQKLKQILTCKTTQSHAWESEVISTDISPRASLEAATRPDNFHEFERTAPPWRTLAVDASLASILDCGAFVVVLLKVAWEVWQLGSRRIREGIETQLQVARSSEFARQKMALMEIEAAIAASKYLSGDDLVLLDRPLCVRSSSLPSFKQTLQALDLEVKGRRLRLLGVCKSSRLRVESGAPLIGFLLQRASFLGFSGRWFYLPIIEPENQNTLKFGEPCVASLDPTQGFAFRIDLGGNLAQVEEAKKTLGSAACLGDKFAYGYPYPLRSVHEACAISRTEVDICRQRLFEAARKQGVLSDLRFALKATSFREEVLLS